MSKAGTKSIIAALRERDMDHCALLMLLAGMQDSLPDAIERLERVIDVQRDFRKGFNGNRREHRSSIEMTDRAVDLGGSLLAGLRQIEAVDAQAR